MKPNVCDQINCPLNKGGVCLEGFDVDIEECPHAFFEEDDEGDTNDEEIVEVSNDTIANNDALLFTGDAMSDDEVITITYKHLSKLILIMGEPDSGKTTLLASVFNMFQKGPFAGFMYAGSKTQVGFEKRCHLARMASGRTIPDIERTTSNEFAFLHLAVRESSLNSPAIHMLFTDVSGERFKLARDFDEEIQRLTILKRATDIIYVVNGEHLVDNKLKHVTKSDVVKMLNRIQQNNSIVPVRGVRILISKWDKVLEKGCQDQVESFFIKPLFSRFENLIQQVEKVAARSKIIGIDTFLQVCASSPMQLNNELDASDNTNNREFYRLRNK